ncbi:MAG: heme ABC transporter ATP-binding protein [Pseudomonadota bacterium]
MSLSGRGIGVSVGEQWLIKDIDIDVAPGELLVVLGPNGAGKTTLLSVLAGDRPADAGEVALNDVAIEHIGIESLADRRAVVGPPATLAFDFTVRDIVEMGWRRRGRRDQTLHDQAVERAIADCDIGALADRVYMTLSSGERQRVQLARGLVQVWQPEEDTASRWLLLDEPTSNLDIANGISVLERLREKSRQGLGVLAILHDLNLGARYADRVLLLQDGKAAACGRPADVMTADRLSDVYRTPVHVEHHNELNRLVVLT